MIMDYKPEEEIKKAQSKILDLKSNSGYSGSKSLTRDRAIDIINETSGSKKAVFSTTGLISRSLFERHDAPNHFYVTGSFGLVSSIGLGFALSKPEREAIVIDGDASLLTNLGTLVTIGKYKPKNLKHIVLDNNAYSSCSGEKSCSDSASIPLISALQGYESVYLANTQAGLEQALGESESRIGPKLIHAKINIEGRRDFKRPLQLYQVTQRFKEYFR
jgi:phosphonopyruvate decarboxylase